MKRSTAWLALALLLLFSALLLKGALLRLPEVPDQAQPAAFDTRAAVARLARVLGDERPHPVDSDANDGVRARLIAELRALGLAPRVTDDFVCNAFARGRTVSCARVRNIVATLGPAEPGPHVLLVAHYDSTSAGPGAADAGIGVATMLEVAARLRGSALQRPVTFLFNEGEEAGLLGARAFLARDPLADRIGWLINLEARGVEGPATMFETSRPNAAAVALFARTSDRPVANSLMTDFYKLLPNSTDVAVFEERPWTILNFAIGGNETRYHSPGDDLAALDRRSVRHMGEQALAAVRHLAAGHAPAARGERAFMDIAGRQLIVLPLSLSLALLGLLALLLLWIGWRRRDGLGIALAALLGAIAGATALAWVAQWIMGLMRAGAWWRGYPEVTSGAIYLTALLACFPLVLLARRVGSDRLRTAFWLLFVAAGGLLSLVAPGGSILPLLPAAAAVAAMLLGHRWPRAEPIGAVVAVLLLLLIFAPFLHLLEVFLGHGAAWIYAPVAALILLPFLIELSPLAARGSGKRMTAGLALAAVAGWTAVGLTPAYSPDRKQHFTIEYVWDQNQRRGRWLVNNDGAPLPSAFSSAGGWERAELPFSSRRRWVAQAPALPLAPPRVTPMASAASAEGRRVRIRLATGGADSVSIRLPSSAQAQAAGVTGFVQRFRPGGSADAPYYLHCHGRSCDGATFDLLLGRRERVEALLIGVHHSLPDQARPLVAARPGNAQPHYAGDQSIALNRMRF